MSCLFNTVRTLHTAHTGPDGEPRQTENADGQPQTAAADSEEGSAPKDGEDAQQQQNQQENPSSPAASVSRNGDGVEGGATWDRSAHDSQHPRRDPLEELEDEEVRCVVFVLCCVVLCARGAYSGSMSTQ